MAEEMPGIGAVLSLVLPFAIIGGLMATLIFYSELQHHFGVRRAIVESAKMGVAAFVFLTVLSLAFAAVLPYVLR